MTTRNTLTKEFFLTDGFSDTQGIKPLNIIILILSIL